MNIMSTKQLANAIRMLSVDSIQKANSGHPGMPLGMADIATVLWRNYLNHDPSNPNWINRDRFILSNGHGSMLLYSLLHLTGYNLSIEDLKNFRQLHSKTPGHPEYGYTDGVEVTTGPLGQGLANAVGMALAEKILAEQFNRPNFNIIDHYTYVFAGDGCLMEGISHEACSFAGTQKLSKLMVFWDDNKISIDGHTPQWFSEDIPQRFASYGWHVITNVDAYDADSLMQAISAGQKVKDKPTLICCKTIIGFGAPNVCDSHDCHGSPLGNEEINNMRANLNWQYPAFEIPQEIYSAWDAREQGGKLTQEWGNLFSQYQQQYPDLAKEFLRRIANELPSNFSQHCQDFINELNAKPTAIATRKASQNTLESYSPLLPEFCGGSADLTSSNLTNWSGSKDITAEDSSGNYIRYGVREFGMCAMMNGIALHKGLIPYGGTFLVFSDYARNAIRMASLMKCRSIFVLTHDSIGLGEDGPTHQPVEHVSSLRLIPNNTVWRPCDTVETAVAWQHAIENLNGPACLILTRQKVPQQLRNAEMLANIKRGGYVLVDHELHNNEQLDGILMATGSEVALAVDAEKILRQQGKKFRVVSLPSLEVFAQQDEQYQESVLPSNITKRIAIEAGVSAIWYKYVGCNGKIIGIDRFGESAPDVDLFKEFGFTVENVVKNCL